MIINLADLDVIYISYDEPNAEENWADLLNKVPWAQRVHGIEGSDAAHKAAAELSKTDRLITVDGDNIVNEDFFNNQLQIESEDEVFSWKGLNIINGLTYGNGGLKCWPKKVIQEMKTHEAADSEEAQVEFCWDLNYTQMYNCYSTTVINGSPYQAWRAGFREGVKMCLKDGVKLSTEDFNDMPKRNKEHLEIWLNVGQDSVHGDMAIQGARYGVYNTMLTDWNWIDVRDFKQLKELYEEHKNRLDYAAMKYGNYADDIERRLGLKIIDFNQQQSAFFKKYYNKHQNKEFKLSEMDYIQRKEGW